nr:MAG: hypothetical protein [Bacteriophage sp.]
MTPKKQKSKDLASSLVRLGKRKELTMKKLFGWIWSKKQQEPEYFFEPVWTPREINDQKYEARQRRERYLAAKYLNDR